MLVCIHHMIFMIAPEDNFRDLYKSLYLSTSPVLRKFKPKKRKSPAKKFAHKSDDQIMIDSFLMYDENNLELATRMPYTPEGLFG